MDCMGLALFILPPSYALLITFALACRLLHGLKSFPLPLPLLFGRPLLTRVLSRNHWPDKVRLATSHIEHDVQHLLAIDRDRLPSQPLTWGIYTKVWHTQHLLHNRPSPQSDNSIVRYFHTHLSFILNNSHKLYQQRPRQVMRSNNPRPQPPSRLYLRRPRGSAHSL